MASDIIKRKDNKKWSVDSIVHKNEKLSKILDGFILFENSGGTTENISLNDSVENYRCIDIFYTWGNQFGKCCRRIYDPNNQILNLDQIVCNSNQVYLGYSIYNISDKSIILNTGEYWRINTSGGVTQTKNNIFKIFKVVGYK